MWQLYLCIMQSLKDSIATIREEIKETAVSNAEQLEQFRIKFLGTKGKLKSLMGEMRNVAKEQRREAGQMLNEIKNFTEARFEELKSKDRDCSREERKEYGELKVELDNMKNSMNL